jgi:hypothetical protein
MRAVWVGVYDRGMLPTERVHFRAALDVDLVRYLLFDTNIVRVGLAGSLPTGVWLGNKTCYWFPSAPIRAGENVVVYTRAGIASTETRRDGAIYHFLFRGLSAPLYTHPDACPVLFELLDWAAAIPPAGEMISLTPAPAK